MKYKTWDDFPLINSLGELEKHIQRQKKLQPLISTNKKKQKQKNKTKKTKPRS